MLAWLGALAPFAVPVTLALTVVAIAEHSEREGALMQKVWRFIRRYWWAVVGIAAAVGGVLLALFVSNNDKTDPSPTPSLKDRAELEVEKVRLEGEIEKARVETRADVRREELDRIEEVAKEDPVEARRQLSAWLNSNL